jgi:coenzyme F420 hydrogenase subunit beta
VDVCSGIKLDHSKDLPDGSITSLYKSWGPVLELWEGFASDQEIRFRGGSGGGATALAEFGLAVEGMHGVLHVGMDPDRPWLNQTIMSHDRTALLNRTGSRYAPASVCAELGSIERASGPCLMIAKPCDVAAARKAAAKNTDLHENLGLTISIFCGGTPSTRGTLEVLRQLGVDPENTQDLRYRGHGWPGMTGVNLRTSPDGTRVEMTYAQAWGEILTRHKPFRCHICPDGTGEFADIACGDPWYREPLEGEHGSTLFVIRTPRGREFFHRAMQEGFIVAEPRDPGTLPASQIGLLMRRSHIWPKAAGAFLFRLPFPTFQGFFLFRNFFDHLGLLRKPVALGRGLRASLGLKRRGPLKLTGEAERVTAGVQRNSKSATGRS